MTILEKKSGRKKTAIYDIIKNGEYSLGYALSEVERLSDSGKLIDSDYEELATYIEELLNKEETEEVQAAEETTKIAEDVENVDNTVESEVE